jgi:hypothetical protein
MCRLPSVSMGMGPCRGVRIARQGGSRLLFRFGGPSGPERQARASRRSMRRMASKLLPPNSGRRCKISSRAASTADFVSLGKVLAAITGLYRNHTGNSSSIWRASAWNGRYWSRAIVANFSRRWRIATSRCGLTPFGCVWPNVRGLASR